METGLAEHTVVSDVHGALKREQDRVFCLEQELTRVNQLLQQKQRYVAALEMDFEHLLMQLERGQLKRAS